MPDGLLGRAFVRLLGAAVAPVDLHTIRHSLLEDYADVRVLRVMYNQLKPRLAVVGRVGRADIAFAVFCDIALHVGKRPVPLLADESGAGWKVRHGLHGCNLGCSVDMKNSPVTVSEDYILPTDLHICAFQRIHSDLSSSKVYHASVLPVYESH